MSSQTPPEGPGAVFDEIPESCQLQNTTDQGGSSPAGDIGNQEEPEANDMYQDADVFCAYRNHRYSQSHAESLDLLHRMDHAQANDRPWHFDNEPLSVAWPDAEDPNTRHIRGSYRQSIVEPTNITTSDPRPSFDWPRSVPLTPENSAQQLALRETVGQLLREVTRSDTDRVYPVPQCIPDPARNSRRDLDSREPNTQTADTTDVEGNSAREAGDPEVTAPEHRPTEQPENQDEVSLDPEPDDPEPEPADINPQDADHTGVTVGWEIEFLVPLAKAKRDVPDAILRDGRYFIPEEDYTDLVMVEGRPARQHIARLLREAAIPAVHADHHDPVEIAIAAAYLPDPEALDVSDPYAIWKVVSDSSAGAGPGPGPGLHHVGLELNSRRLPAGGAGVAELRRVLGLVRNNVLVGVNDTCGLHVHVGATDLGLHGQHHLVCLYLAVERVLFSLCHTSRHANKYCRPVLERSQLADEAEDAMRQRRAGKPDQGREDEEEEEGESSSNMSTKLRLMHAAVHDLDSTEQLNMSLRRPNLPRNALNMKEVGPGRHTFEFRHFQSSLDVAVVRQWTRVCIALVLVAQDLGEDDQRGPTGRVYDIFYRVSCQPEGTAWRGLLMILGLGDAVTFWKRMRSSYPPPPSQEEYSDSDSSYLDLGFDSEAGGLQYLPRVL